MTTQRPRILVTNDDGILAKGIRALIEVAQEFGEVVVVAPDQPQSGQGHAITMREPLRLRKVNPFDDVEAYECSGTPVDCVKLAKQVVMKDNPPILCLSASITVQMLLLILSIRVRCRQRWRLLSKG